MRGFIRQRGAPGSCVVYLGTDPVTGKKRYATKTVRGGKPRGASGCWPGW